MSIERIFILHHTHVDLGYTGPREQVCRDLVDMVDEAIDRVAEHAAAPADERFRWIHEVSWPLLRYLERAGARRDELLQQIRRGDAELTALYVNPTDLFDRSTFEISIDRACALAGEHDLPLNTAMFCDCPGIAWSVVDVLAARGIRYLSTAPNYMMSLPLEVKRPFYWEGPEGGRLLTWFSDWRNVWYGEGYTGFGLSGDPVAATGKLLAYVRQLEGDGYCWKGLAIHAAIDNQPPCPQLLDSVRHFNSSQSLVRVQMATNRQFFEFMERCHAAEFPVHRGAWPDWWANGHASAAWETACSRRAKASLSRSGALAGQLGCQREQALVEEVMENLLMFDEHTWGRSNCAADPWSVEPRLHWCDKRRFAAQAFQVARTVEAALLKNVVEAESIAVLNPFDGDVSGPVRLPGEGSGGPPGGLEDAATGESVAVQCVRASQAAAEPGRVCWLDVPPRSTRRLRGTAGAEPVPPLFEGLRSEYYSIDHDPETGAVRAVTDARLGVPLVDPAAQWGWAELVHERIRGGSREKVYNPGLGITNPESKRPRPEFIQTAGHRRHRRALVITGPVYNALVTRGRLPGVRFVREIRLYHGGPRIDVILRLDKQVVTRYESLYLAFPFLATTPDVVVENAGAVYRAGVEQLPGSATDWHSVGDYVAVCDDARTVLLVPHDAPLIQIGDINTGKWSRTLEVSSGHIYSWPMNNLWYTNFPAYQEGAVTLTWSLTSHEGGFDRGRAEQFARSARVGPAVSTGGSR